MKERGMLYSDPMVRKLLSDEKLQTRRIAKVSNGGIGAPVIFGPVVKGRFSSQRKFARLDTSEGRERAVQWCPHGVVGDRIWVREAFYCDNVFAGDATRGTVEDWLKMTYYRADYADEHAWAQAEEWAEGTPPWTPSIHMPRWASRITLEITDVRVQRLREISEADALAEGVDPYEQPAGPATPDAVAAFAELWDRLNGERASWSSNPFVWAISFRRVETKLEAA